SNGISIRGYNSSRMIPICLPRSFRVTILHYTLTGTKSVRCPLHPDSRINLVVGSYQNLYAEQREQCAAPLRFVIHLSGLKEDDPILPDPYKCQSKPFLPGRKMNPYPFSTEQNRSK